jgi:hypothetical protein
MKVHVKRRRLDSALPTDISIPRNYEKSVAKETSRGRKFMVVHRSPSLPTLNSPQPLRRFQMIEEMTINGSFQVIRLGKRQDRNDLAYGVASSAGGKFVLKKGNLVLVKVAVRN